MIYSCIPNVTVISRAFAAPAVNILQRDTVQIPLAQPRILVFVDPSHPS